MPRSGVQSAGYCLGCGYDLRATEAGRCPECGRAFDFGDPTSYARHDRTVRHLWIIARPAAWIDYVTGAAAVGMVWGAAALPGGNQLAGGCLLLMLAFFGLGTSWRGVRKAAAWRLGVAIRDPSAKNQATARWMAPAALYLCLFDIPLQLNVLVSSPSIIHAYEHEPMLNFQGEYHRRGLVFGYVWVGTSDVVIVTGRKPAHYWGRPYQGDIQHDVGSGSLPFFWNGPRHPAWILEGLYDLAQQLAAER
jgi:hypothetical protein